MQQLEAGRSSARLPPHGSAPERRPPRPFLVCIHDATPAYEHETRVIIRDLAALVGTRISSGVVPDWHGQWPLAAHRDYCELIRESSEELLLHGYLHRRQRGGGPTSFLTGAPTR